MKNAICLLLILMFAVPPGSAHAWSENGHHIIAVMAFDLLNKDEQAKIISLLERHPRYTLDFVPPEDLHNDLEKQRWRIGRAGYWPDVIRKNLDYDRPTWHYQLGPSLVIGNLATLKVPERPGALPKDANLATQTLHITQALELCKQTLADKSRSDADRAIAFCWIAHLVADAHQPCHAGSLYMEKVFPEEDGDRGATRIPTNQDDNLHILWDRLLGNMFTLNDALKRMSEITSDEALVAQGKAAIKSADRLAPLTWLSESGAEAVEHVYTPEVLDSLQLVARGLVKEPKAIELQDAYLNNARTLAKRRAIQAAYRLAETWRTAID